MSLKLYQQKRMQTLDVKPARGRTKKKEKQNILKNMGWQKKMNEKEQNKKKRSFR